jgi:hypothetical protein
MVKGYFESQVADHCVVHAYNNMVGKRVLSATALAYHCRENPQQFPSRHIWYRPHRRFSGTFFRADVLVDWFDTSHPGQQLVEARISYSSRGTAETVLLRAQQAMQKCRATVTDRFMVANHDHMFALRRDVDGQWHRLDSMCAGWEPVDKGAVHWLDVESVFFVAPM